MDKTTQNTITKLAVSFFIIFAVLVIDQVFKIYIKTHFTLNESFHVFGDWFKLVFVENKGMAFGWEIPFLSEQNAKILLSLFRLLAVGLIMKYMFNLSKKGAPTGLIISIALIFAGAFGNIIDSAFYGLIFTESMPYSDEVATFTEFAGENSYEGFLTGRVVDMLRFDLFTIGDFNFFAPIFNIADVSISVGVGIILLFQRRAFQKYFFPKKGQAA